MKNGRKKQEQIHLGAHGEDYGNWMPVSMLRLVGGLAALAAVLSLLSFAVFHITALGVVFVIDALLLLALLLWITWIRRRYAFEGGGMMEQVHQIVLSHLDFDGQGQLLDVGCGSGALSIRAALTWRAAQVVGIDYWGSAYGYGQAMCEKNAESEGVAAQCRFQHGDANRLDFPDESFDAVVSNYVYHNITGADKRALLRETLRVLKKGGVFALNDEMKPPVRPPMKFSANSAAPPPRELPPGTIQTHIRWMPKGRPQSIQSQRRSSSPFLMQADLKMQYSSPAMATGPGKFDVGGLGGAAEGGHQQFPICLIGIADIVNGRFQR